MIKINNSTLILIGLILYCAGCTITMDIRSCLLFVLFCAIMSNFLIIDIEINGLLCCIVLMMICCGMQICINNNIMAISFN